MPKYQKIIFVVLLFVLLILVRALAPKCLYDPLIQYFNDDYLHKEVPNVNTSQLFFSYFTRYFINALISLAVIYIVYPVKRVMKFSIWFYISMFFVMICLFFIVLHHLNTGHLLLFYIRRFIIHPLFVLILIPAFYYSRTLNQKD